MSRAALFAMLTLLAAPGIAEAAPCGPTAYVTTRLAEKYHEHLVGRAAYQPDSGRWRLLYAQQTGLPDQPRTWTVLEIMPRGVSCIVQAGNGLPQWVTEVISGRAEL